MILAFPTSMWSTFIVHLDRLLWFWVWLATPFSFYHRRLYFVILTASAYSILPSIAGGLVLSFKGQRWLGGWSLSLSVHGYRYRGISRMFQRYRYILRCPGVHKEEGTVRSRSGDHHNNILQKLLFRKKTRTFIRYLICELKEAGISHPATVAL